MREPARITRHRAWLPAEGAPVLPGIDVPERSLEERTRDARRGYKREHPEQVRVQNRSDQRRNAARDATRKAEYSAVTREQKPWIWMTKSARDRARKLGIPFSITADDVRAIWPEDNRCPITGVDLKRAKGRLCNESASMDRIVPDEGYVVGNIAILSVKANRQKGDLTADEHRKIADWMDSVRRGDTQ